LDTSTTTSGNEKREERNSIPNLVQIAEFMTLFLDFDRSPIRGVPRVSGESDQVLVGGGNMRDAIRAAR
jgi:hypothetical protein